ncbi:uncharacterized protein LOC132609727 isoform X2 [Lycium barbarum]|uniref:uncharacterized protein LOC132609727 isoform X2 n=1 Tax=Lycium barbarum TaxID=112863 RepID=UPI00293F04E7|nr:uncharacterized protein LOC132609727 isoform X2 [Lycium barbarum]
MQQQVQSWDVRMTSLAVVGHDTSIHMYIEWYMRITRIIIGNPSRCRPDGLGYVALAGAFEALVRTVQTMRYESTARTKAPETAEYAARMIELAETGMRQAHDFERLHERVPAAPPGAADGPGRRGVGGRRRGGRAGRGVEAPSTLEIPPSSYQLATTDIPLTSHSRPSTSQTPLYAPGPTEETVEESAQEPFHQASQEVHSSAPVDPSPDEIDEEPCYEPAPPPTVISHRKHVMNWGPGRKKGRKGSKDDHAIEHVQIKRRKGDGDDGGGGGVSLRPSRTLKAPICGT